MRKVLLITGASCALIALVPATALAKHGDRRHHQRARHARVHRRRPRWSTHDRGRGDDAGGGNDQGDNDNETRTTAALVPGAVVHEARLAISGAGATWDEVELIPQSSGSSDS